jgi:lipoprotein NlpD
MKLQKKIGLGVSLCLVAVLAGCASSSRRAPIEDRGSRSTGSSTHNVIVMPSADGTVPVKVLPGAENAGKPGYYTVKAGDTLRRIGLETGQAWKDLVLWNNLDNPNVIEVGQVLRVVPPGVNPLEPGTQPIAMPGSLEPRSLESTASAASAASPSPAASSPAPVVDTTAKTADDDINWAWPATGTVVTNFDEVKSKGIAIAGKAGDSVLAAADGRVIFAGSSLRGYGNLIILKHNTTYLTAYAHNQTLLVKADQAVRRGQRIAEMGSTDAERVQLHFEIRKQGKPLDPARLLPPR